MPTRIAGQGGRMAAEAASQSDSTCRNPAGSSVQAPHLKTLKALLFRSARGRSRRSQPSRRRDRTHRSKNGPRRRHQLVEHREVSVRVPKAIGRDAQLCLSSSANWDSARPRHVGSSRRSRPSPTSTSPERRAARKGAPSGAAELPLRASTVLAFTSDCVGRPGGMTTSCW